MFSDAGLFLENEQLIFLVIVAAFTVPKQAYFLNLYMF